LLGKYDQTIKKLEKLYFECGFINIQIRIKSLLANIYAISQKYKEAINNLDYVVNNIDKINDKETKNLAYSASAIVYYLISQYELSIKFSELMIDMNQSGVNSCKAQVLNYSSRLELTSRYGSFNEIPQVINECHKLGENIYAQDLNVNWLKYRYKRAINKNELYQILDEVNQVNDVIDDLKYKNLIGLKNSLLAQLYALVDEPHQALKYANLAIKDSKTLGTTEQKIDALQVLIDYYQDKQDYKTANQYLIEKNYDEKRYYNDEQAKIMAYQTVKHDNLAKTHQIKALNQQNKLLVLEQEIDKKDKRDQQLINVFFVILLAIFLYFGYKSRKQHRKFKRLSELDHMTLIYNRMGIKDFIGYLLPYAEKKNEIIGFCIFDLDLFKNINDHYGHITGDWVIKEVIKVCQNLNNEKLTFARLGGEEFSIIVQHTTLDETLEFSEQCRKAIYDINTLNETGYDFQISASFGVTSSNESGYDYDNLMKHADSALYHSKGAGRNRISVYGGTASLIEYESTNK